MLSTEKMGRCTLQYASPCDWPAGGGGRAPPAPEPEPDPDSSPTSDPTGDDSARGRNFSTEFGTNLGSPPLPPQELGLAGTPLGARARISGRLDLKFFKGPY